MATTPHTQTITVQPGDVMIDVQYEEDKGNSEMTLAPHGHQPGWNVEQLRDIFQSWCTQEQTTNNAQIRMIGTQIVGLFPGTPLQKLEALQGSLQRYFEQHLTTTQGKAKATGARTAGSAGNA